jgi:VanZ family protein
MKLPEIFELQGGDIATAPHATGIYAWYYRPRVFYGDGKDGVAAAISQFMNTRTRLEAEVKVRYGLRFRGESDLDTLYGTDRVPAASVITDAVDKAGDFVKAFIQGLMTPHFAKPLYIGIAKVLHNRVYKDHYLDLCNLWDSSSSVSRYLSSHRDASIHDVLTDLRLNHSFAIEARVRNLAPRDLVVFVCPTKELLKIEDATAADGGEDSPVLRTLEQVLQLLADPICGRR